MAEVAGDVAIEVVGITVRVSVPDLRTQKSFMVHPDETVWATQQALLEKLAQVRQHHHNSQRQKQQSHSLVYALLVNVVSMYHQHIPQWSPSFLSLLYALQELPKDPNNYGLYLPPTAAGKQGRFLDETRFLGEYPLQGKTPHLEVHVPAETLMHLACMMLYYLSLPLFLAFLCSVPVQEERLQPIWWKSLR